MVGSLEIVISRRNKRFGNILIGTFDGGMFGVSKEILFLEVRNEVQDFGLSENETVHKKRKGEGYVF